MPFSKYSKTKLRNETLLKIRYANLKYARKEVTEKTGILRYFAICPGFSFGKRPGLQEFVHQFKENYIKNSSPNSHLF